MENYERQSRFSDNFVKSYANFNIICIKVYGTHGKVNSLLINTAQHRTYLHNVQ
jgi:hypothetical protein